jgi:hypothetical protein
VAARRHAEHSGSAASASGVVWVCEGDIRQRHTHAAAALVACLPERVVEPSSALSHDGPCVCPSRWQQAVLAGATAVVVSARAAKLDHHLQLCRRTVPLSAEERPDAATGHEADWLAVCTPQTQCKTF